VFQREGRRKPPRKHKQDDMAKMFSMLHPRFSRGFRPGQAPVESPMISGVGLTADQVKGEVQQQIFKEKVKEQKLKEE